MLLGLIAGNDTGIKGIAVYVLVYTFMNLGAFLVVVALRRAEHHRRGSGRSGRPDAQEPGLRHPDADLPALAGRHSADRRLPRQVLHFPGADRDRALRAGRHRRRCTSRWRSTTTSRSCAACSSARQPEKAPALATSFGLRVALALSGVADAGHRTLSRAVPAARADIAVPVNALWRPSSTIRCSCRILVTLVIIAVFPLMAGYIVLVERKVLADFQVRLGPMRVGPHGLLQPHRRRAEAAAEGRHHPDRRRTRRSSGSRPCISTFTALTAFAVLPFSN